MVAVIERNLPKAEEFWTPTTIILGRMYHKNMTLSHYKHVNR